MGRELTVWQQNLNKSQTGQHDLISSGKLISSGIDIIAIQEPSINVLGLTVTSRDWIPLYPLTHKKDQRKTQAITLINSKLPTESWEQLEFQSGDVVVVKIMGSWGQIVLFNIYNDCSHDRTLNELTKFHRINRGLIVGNKTDSEMHHTIWLGNFNRHHPAWDRLEDHRLFTREALEMAENLIKAIADHSLNMALAPGMPTHIHNVMKKWSRLDQVFVTEHTLEEKKICEACIGERGLNTDHVPIVMKVDTNLGRTEKTKTSNFRDVDWDEFHKVLEERMSGFGILRRLAKSNRCKS